MGALAALFWLILRRRRLREGSEVTTGVEETRDTAITTDAATAADTEAVADTDTPSDPDEPEPAFAGWARVQRRRNSLLALEHDAPWVLHGDYAAFLTCYRPECETEARLCQSELERRLEAPTFLSSSDDVDLHETLERVRKSDVLLFFQTASVLTRPHCLLELHEAIAAQVPVVAVNVRGRHEYEYGDAAQFLQNLDSEIERRNPGATRLLQLHEVDPSDLAYELSMVVPNLISIHLDPSGSHNMLQASLLDLVHTMRVAKPTDLEDVAERESRDDWLEARGRGDPPSRRRS